MPSRLFSTIPGPIFDDGLTPYGLATACNYIMAGYVCNKGYPYASQSPKVTALLNDISIAQATQERIIHFLQDLANLARGKALKGFDCIDNTQLAMLIIKRLLFEYKAQERLHIATVYVQNSSSSDLEKETRRHQFIVISTDPEAANKNYFSDPNNFNCKTTLFYDPTTGQTLEDLKLIKGYMYTEGGHHFSAPAFGLTSNFEPIDILHSSDCSMPPIRSSL